MFNVCYQCGEYRVDKTIDPAGPYAICPVCGYRHLFAYEPLFIVCGPSGAGKSTLCAELMGRVTDLVVLDGDILLGSEPHFETWLRMGKNLNQSKRPLLLFSSGAIPPNIEPCVERRYFSAVHYLAVICEPDQLRERLLARPAWRGTHDEAYIQEHSRFNDWLIAQAALPDSPIELLDTTTVSVETAVSQLTAWLREKWPSAHGET